MALRADTARHIITGVTILIFSAAAIGTAMRYQDRGFPTQLPATAELPAREAIAPANPSSPAPAGYTDGMRGSGADIAAKLDGTLALGAATVWPNRQGGGSAAAAGSAGWWGNASAKMTPTGGRRRGPGSGISLPGSGYTVSGGARDDRPASANGPRSDRGRGSNGNDRGNGGGGGGNGNDNGPVFGDHNPSVGDLIDNPVDGLDGGVGTPGGGLNPGGLSHTPEPASLLLMATGLVGVLGAARRRRQMRKQ